MMILKGIVHDTPFIIMMSTKHIMVPFDDHVVMCTIMSSCTCHSGHPSHFHIMSPYPFVHHVLGGTTTTTPFAHHVIVHQKYGACSLTCHFPQMCVFWGGGGGRGGVKNPPFLPPILGGGVGIDFGPVFETSILPPKRPTIWAKNRYMGLSGTTFFRLRYFEK